MSIFKNATRQKLRFQTHKGILSVEQVWDLPLTQLNSLAKSLKKEIKETEEEDFLEDSPCVDQELKLKFDTVLDILETKKAERKAEAEKKEKKEKKAKLLALLAKKRDEALESKSEEDLLKELEALS